MKSLLFVLLFSWLQPFLMGQDCGSSVSTFYDCVLNGLKATPEEGAMMDTAMACFKDNSCKTPEELKSCVMTNMENISVPVLKTCIRNHTADLPPLDFDRLKSIRNPFVAIGLMKKPGALRAILGKLCNGNNNNADQVQNCLGTLMNSSHGEHHPGGIFSKFAHVKTCWTDLPQPCKQKLISAKSELCCCASQVDLKSKIRDAAGSCGISVDDFNMAAGEMGKLIEKFCANPRCS